MDDPVIDWHSRSQELSLNVRDFIDGTSLDVGGVQADKLAPRDGSVLYSAGIGTLPTVDVAVAAARKAYKDGRWSRYAERRAAVDTLASILEAHSEELALLECIDTGKPIRDVLSIDLPMAVSILRTSAEMADKLQAQVYSSDSTNLSYQLRRPVGVVAGIVGWNFPLVLAASKIGPALAMGNSLVLKPSEITSLTTARVAELGLIAGIPPGVLNIIHGDAAIGQALAEHMDVDLLTFTGSTVTGRSLLIASGRSNMKRLLLECGGKAANIVFEDCPDLASVADAVVARAFWNQGQVCTASSRLLVQQSIQDALLELVIEGTSKLTPGDPLDPSTNFGPVVSRGHQKKVNAYIEMGEASGANIAHRWSGSFPFEKGYYVGPTIFSDVAFDHPLARDEIFGPVLTVIPFRDEVEAVKLANETIYGLSAIVWTKDIGRAHRMAHALDVGWTVINATECPAAGPVTTLVHEGQKQSGFGAEGGFEGMISYTRQTSVQYFV